jgi:hypothetical protein
MANLIFGDDMATIAMIDRLIHRSTILSLKGGSYRLRGKDLEAAVLGAQRLRCSRVSAALPEHLHPADQLAREGKEDRDRHLMRLPFVAIPLSHLNGRTLPINEDALDLEHRQQPRGIMQQTPDLIESYERV